MPAISRYLVVLPPNRRPRTVGRSSLSFYVERGATVWPLDGITADKARQLIKAGKLEPLYQKGEPVGSTRVPCEVAVKKAIATKSHGLGAHIYLFHEGGGKAPPGRYTLVAQGWEGEQRLFTIHRCGPYSDIPTYSLEKYLPEEFAHGKVEVYVQGSNDGVRFTTGSIPLTLVEGFPFGEPRAKKPPSANARCLEYAKGDLEFASWLTDADVLCLKSRGVSIFDLGDFAWRDRFNDECSAEDAFADFAAEEGVEVRA